MMEFFVSQRVYFRPTPVELLKEAEVSARVCDATNPTPTTRTFCHVIFFIFLPNTSRERKKERKK